MEEELEKGHIRPVFVRIRAGEFGSREGEKWDFYFTLIVVRESRKTERSIH